MSTYLVTGGAGFIGSNIVEELLKQGHRVRVLDNFITGKKENLKPFANDIELFMEDVRNLEPLKKAMKGADYVLHQAALRSVPKSVDDPVLTNDINICGTLNVLLAAKAAGVKRIVYASSSSAYGDCAVFPQREDLMPMPISPYAVSKLAGEHYAVTFAKTFGLETVSLRYFNVFGPRQNPESQYSAVIPAFIDKILKGERPVVDGDGKQSRDFTYVKNVVNANIAAAAVPGISGEVINVACGITTSVLDIITVLDVFLWTKTKPEFGPPRKGDVKKTIADVTKMKRLLKINVEVDFTSGLKKTLEWFQSRVAVKGSAK